MRAGATRLLLQCMADLYSHPWVAAAAAAGADTSVVRLPMRSIGSVRASNMSHLAQRRQRRRCLDAADSTRSTNTNAAADALSHDHNTPLERDS